MKKKSTIGDNSAGLRRHFEFFSREFENGGEWSSFWNTKSEIRLNTNEMLKRKIICGIKLNIYIYIEGREKQKINK